MFTIVYWDYFDHSIVFRFEILFATWTVYNPSSLRAHIEKCKWANAYVSKSDVNGSEMMQEMQKTNN